METWKGRKSQDASAAPHSLGKLFEWKQSFDLSASPGITSLPTRWGNYLNGNPSLLGQVNKARQAEAPHSLGKLFEWKHKPLFHYHYKLSLIHI